MRVDELRIGHEDDVMRRCVNRLCANLAVSIHAPSLESSLKDHRTHPFLPAIPETAGDTVLEDRPLPPPKREHPDHNKEIGDAKRGSHGRPHFLPPRPSPSSPRTISKAIFDLVHPFLRIYHGGRLCARNERWFNKLISI